MHFSAPPFLKNIIQNGTFRTRCLSQWSAYRLHSCIVVAPRGFIFHVPGQRCAVCHDWRDVASAASFRQERLKGRICSCSWFGEFFSGIRSFHSLESRHGQSSRSGHSNNNRGPGSRILDVGDCHSRSCKRICRIHARPAFQDQR